MFWCVLSLLVFAVYCILMFDDCYLLFGVFCLPLWFVVVRVRCLLFVVCCLLSVVVCCLFVDRCLLLEGSCSLFVACCVLLYVA